MEEIRGGESTRFGFYLVNLDAVITASLAIKVESVSLLYVAHDSVIDVVSIKNLKGTFFLMACNVYFCSTRLIAQRRLQLVQK